MRRVYKNKLWRKTLAEKVEKALWRTKKSE